MCLASEQMSFYDLPIRRSRVLRDPPPIEQGGWILTGIVSEWTTLEESHYGYRKVAEFKWVSGGGGVRNEQQRGEFDYLDFVARHDENYTGPKSFEGVSGGGLWQVVPELVEDGGVAIKEAVLSGVAFHQTITEQLSTIACHGRRSIYERVVAELIARS
jgi:hypothetical protein